MNVRFMRLTSLLLAGILLIVALTACQNTEASRRTDAGTPEINVFAGSASKPPLDEAAQAFERQTGNKVYLTYGGSGSVLSQMMLARTGDVYIPGSPDYLIKAEKNSVIKPDSTGIIAYLIPVIAVQKGNPKNIRSLSDLARPGITVGIGNPEAVCLGLYSMEIFNFNNLLAEISPNIVTQADSCEKTASLLSLKSVDAIIGWDVFQHWAPEDIDIIYLAPEQTPRLAYIPAAVSSYADNPAEAAAFIDFLKSPAGRDIFRKWGYRVTEEEARQYAPDAQIGGEYHYQAHD